MKKGIVCQPASGIHGYGAVANDSRIVKALDLMRQGDPIKATDIAGALNLSVSRLRHLFKQETGISMKQFQKLLRLSCARELVENSFLTIKEITVLVGVTDVSHFTRDFKALYGKTPSQARVRSSAVRKRSE